MWNAEVGIYMTSMPENTHPEREKFVRESKRRIDELNEGAVIYFDFDETIAIEDEENGDMKLNPELLEIVEYAKQCDKNFVYGLLTSTPEWTTSERGLRFPQVLIDKQVTRRPFLVDFQETAGIDITEYVYDQHQTALLGIEVPEERLRQLFGDELEELSERMLHSLLTMEASPLSEEAHEYVKKLRTDGASPTVIINVLLNSSVKNKYMILLKDEDGNYRFNSVKDAILFDDKRGGAVGEVLNMGVLVPRSKEDHERYEETAEKEDILLRVFSALSDHDLHISLSQSRKHKEGSSEGEIYVGKRAREIKESLVLVSVVEALHSEAFIKNPNNFYRYVLTQARELESDFVYIYLNYTPGEAIVKLDLKKFRHNAREKGEEEASYLGEVFNVLAETVLLSLEESRGNLFQNKQYYSPADELYSRVFVGYQINK